MRDTLCIFLLASIFFQATASETFAAEPNSPTVSSELLEAKLAEIKQRPGVVDETRFLMSGLYQQALDDLKKAAADAERTTALLETVRTAPEQIRLLRDREETPESAVSPDSPGPIEDRLTQEAAELAAATARHANIQQELAGAEGRPPHIRTRLDAMKQEQIEVGVALNSVPDPNEDADLSQARRWSREARSVALEAETGLLQQELAGLPARIDLLKVRLESESAGLEQVRKRVESMKHMVHEKRRAEAEVAQTEIEKTRRETAGLDPVLDRLADRNAELARTLSAQATEFGGMKQQREQAERRRERIESDLADLQGTLKAHGRAEGLGRLLLQQRESLPDPRAYRRRADARKQQIAWLGVQRLKYRAEARELADPDQAMETYAPSLQADRHVELRTTLTEILRQRRDLLAKAQDADAFYRKELEAVGAAEIDLMKAAQACDEFLDEQLPWLRTADPTRWRDMAGLPGELQRLFAPAVWSELGQTFLRKIIPSPLFWLVVLAAAWFAVKRKVFIRHIQGCAENLGTPLKDRFAYTLRAVGWTLILALPWPLLLATTGWGLRRVDAGSSELSYSVGELLLLVALYFYLLRTLSMMCIPKGVTEAHFGLHEHNARRLRTGLGRLAWLYLFIALVVGLAVRLAPTETGGTIARLGLLILNSVLALFLYRVSPIRRGLSAQRKRDSEAGVSTRAYSPWGILLAIFPLGIAGLALSGYVFTATLFTRWFFQSLFLIFGLALLYQFAMRWLRISRRRLAYTATVERRQAAREAREREGDAVIADDSLSIEESEVDLDALSEDTGGLARLVAIAAAFLGLCIIWKDLFPALRIFNEVTLWHTSLTVGSELKQVPVTLGHAGLAVVVAVGTAILARRLPAVLEIILMRFSGVSAGSRHAATTLFTYAIIIVGALVALKAIGFRWAQFQWLIAALGVGIGFGLQEMVANFISGLIILFERPIRVGDVVTVGDTDGVVTRIRIRATTIRNWDRKELIVPNKEFITGRLLNWSLSDQMTRIVVAVGVAYGTDTDRAMALMKEAATEHENVLDDPAPRVSFEGFGDNSLNLLLRACLGAIDKRIPTTTDLHRAIDHKFKEAGIVIAFPQRDVHLDISEPLRISAHHPEGGES